MKVALVREVVAPPSPPIYKGASAESLRAVYARFLSDSYRRVRATAKLYAIAGARLGDAGRDDDLREWLLRHAAEEDRHRERLAADLHALGIDPAPLAHEKPSVWCEALVGTVHHAAAVANPQTILGDAYAMVGLCQIFAGRFATTMQCSLALPDCAVAYLAGLGVADRGHRDELRQLVNTHVRTEEDYGDILQVAKTVSALYTEMLENVVFP